MTTPVIMLGLLLSPYLLTRFIGQLRGRMPVNAGTAGCIGVALVFCLTGMGHFVQTGAMARMLPPWVPEPIALVYISGVVEFLAAAAVLVPRLRRWVGWGLILMLIAFLPVNVYAAFHRVGMGGHEWGPIYLLIRVPLQAILIGWIWWFAVRAERREDVPRI